MYTPEFTAALFTIAKTWKQPKCPSTEEWIKKMFYTHTHTHTHTHTLLNMQSFSACMAHHILTWIKITIILNDKAKYPSQNVDEIQYC